MSHHYFLQQDEEKWKLYMAYKLALFLKEQNPCIQNDSQLIDAEIIERRRKFLHSQLDKLKKYHSFLKTTPLYGACIGETPGQMTMKAKTLETTRNVMCNITGEKNAQLQVVLKKTN